MCAEFPFTYMKR